MLNVYLDFGMPSRKKCAAPARSPPPHPPAPEAGGFLTDEIRRTWRVGTNISVSGPHGTFYYDPLRDSPEIVALAGGTGITPFSSMMRQWAGDKGGPSLTLLYGCRDRSDELPTSLD